MNRFGVSGAFGAFALVPLLLACGKPAETPAAAPAPSASQSAEDRFLGPMLPGVDKQDVVVGSGPPAKNGDRVSVHYTGRLADGTQFDSSVERGVPFEFEVGAHQVVAGWSIGIIGMQKGGKRKITVPPHLGYGLRGSPPSIPPDATLLFDVELLEIYSNDAG